VSITVNEIVNLDPIAVDDTATTTKNTAKQIIVLANDTPNPGGETDTISVTVATDDGPAHGTVTVANNIITYTPENNYVGADSFVYTLSDGKGGTDSATVSITVNDTVVAGGKINGQLFLDSISNLGAVVTSGATPVRSGAFESGDTTLVGVRVHLVG